MKNKATAKLQGDHKVLFRGNWETTETRMIAVREIASDLAGLIG